MSWFDYTPWGAAYNGGKKLLNGDLTNRAGEEQARSGMFGQGSAAGAFADQGQQQFSVLGAKLGDQTQYLQDVARGNQSVSAEQLRQALGQNVAAQRSMAAGAAPQNQAMAALQASRNAMNLGSGLAGQQAVAGMQERQAAQNALMQALLQQRGQEMQVALGSRQNAVGAYGGAPIGKSWMDTWAGPIAGGAQLATGAGK